MPNPQRRSHIPRDNRLNTYLPKVLTRKKGDTMITAGYFPEEHAYGVKISKEVRLVQLESIPKTYTLVFTREYALFSKIRYTCDDLWQ